MELLLNMGMLGWAIFKKKNTLKKGSAKSSQDNSSTLSKSKIVRKNTATFV